MRKYTILALMYAMVMCTQAQEQVSFAVLQDVRLAVTGDDKGNDAFTTNILARVKMQGKQSEYGYLIIYPEFEYANLKQVYLRYSANVGYTLNQLFIKNLEASLIGGIGFINKEGEGSSSFSATGELGYRISRHLKIITDLQLVQRSDIGVGKVSGFAGLELNF